MALLVTNYDKGLTYRIVQQDDVKATINHNVVGGSCTVTSVIINNTLGSATVWVRAANGYAPTIGASLPELGLACAARTKRVYEMPGGILFPTGLSFWASSSSNPQGTGHPTVISSGKITVTFVVT